MRLAGILTTMALLATLGCGGSDDESYEARMATEHAGDEPVASEAAAGQPTSAVEGQEVRYAEVDGSPVTGYLALPSEQSGELPGIIVIHEWWGLNDNVRSMARQLAGEGYAALAVDLYGGRVAETPEQARAIMSEVLGDEPAAEENLRQAYAYLAGEAGSPKIGSIGWCFGGGWSLRTAMLFPDELDGAVIYYGHLDPDPEALAALQMPLLGIFGEADQGIPLDSVREFERVLGELGKDAKIHVYEGAGHAFANPSGKRYDAEAATDAWEKTLTFFTETLH